VSGCSTLALWERAGVRVGCLVFFLSPHLNPLPTGEEIKALHLHKPIHLTAHTDKIHTRRQARHIKPNMSPFGGGACGAGGGG